LLNTSAMITAFASRRYTIRHLVLIDDAKLVTPSREHRHWARMRHAQALAALQPTQQDTRLQPGGGRE
jgi:hypothetical protein